MIPPTILSAESARLQMLEAEARYRESTYVDYTPMRPVLDKPFRPNVVLMRAAVGGESGPLTSTRGKMYR